MSLVRFARLDSDVFAVEGKERVDLLQRLSTKDLRPLHEPLRAGSTVFTTDKGRVVDWCWLTSLPERLLCLASAGRGAAVRAWIDKYTIMEDVRTVALPNWRHVVVFGDDPGAAVGVAWPEVDRVVEAAGGAWFQGLPAYGQRLEGLLPAERADAVLAAAAAAGATSVSPAQLEELRLLAGVPSPEHEFKEEVNPLELRLKVAVSWNKGCYVGQEVISRLDSYDKVARLLMGFRAKTPVDPAALTGRIRREGKALGRVTSLARADEGSLGLCVVGRDAAHPGTAELELEGGALPIELLDRPFWS